MKTEQTAAGRFGCLRHSLVCVLVGLASCLGSLPAQAQQKTPNIVVIWGDDIGWCNVSAYNHGTMGYKTPNIDRLAKEGAMFTLGPAQQFVGQFLGTFREFPPRQKTGSFAIDQALESLTRGAGDR